MIQTLNPFLNYDGQARQAIELYSAVLGAEVATLMPWTEEMFEGDVPPQLKDGVMYALLKIGEAQIELSDVPPSVTVSAGSNMQVILHVAEPAELDAICRGLSVGGEVEMKPEDMFWGARYAKVRDRFGIVWALHCQLEQPQ